MKSLLVISSLATGLLGGSVLQQPSNGTVQPLSRVFGATASATQDQHNTIDTWRERMAGTDLAQRQQHYEQMLTAARRDPELRKALEDWAADGSNLDLAWTARLALRELEASPFAWNGAPHDLFAMPFDLDAQFDAQQWFEQVRDQWRNFDFNGLQPWPNPNAGSGQTGPGQTQTLSSAESFSLSVGPDGVTCEVKRNVDGKEETQEYKAESLDQLLDAHPELRDKLHVGSLDMSFGNGFSGFPRGWGLRSNPGIGANPTSPFATTDNVRTDVLGVVVQPLSADDAKGLGLAAGEGMRIDRVEPGTIASNMGLQRGHVLTELNGTKIKSRDDITAELKKRGTDGALEAVVIDRWGQRRTHSWRPDNARQL